MTFPDFFTLDDTPAAPQISPRAALASADLAVFCRQLGRTQAILDLCVFLPPGLPPQCYEALGRFAYGALCVMEHATAHGDTPPEAFDEMPLLQALCDRARELIACGGIDRSGPSSRQSWSAHTTAPRLIQ